MLVPTLPALILMAAEAKLVPGGQALALAPRAFRSWKCRCRNACGGVAHEHPRRRVRPIFPAWRRALVWLGDLLVSERPLGPFGPHLSCRHPPDEFPLCRRLEFFVSRSRRWRGGGRRTQGRWRRRRRRWRRRRCGWRWRWRHVCARRLRSALGLPTTAMPCQRSAALNR